MFLKHARCVDWVAAKRPHVLLGSMSLVSGPRKQQSLCWRADQTIFNSPPATCPQYTTSHTLPSPPPLGFFSLSVASLPGYSSFRLQVIVIRIPHMGLAPFDAALSLTNREKNYRPQYKLEKTHQQSRQPKHTHLLKGFRSKRPTVTCLSQRTTLHSTAQIHAELVIRLANYELPIQKNHERTTIKVSKWQSRSICLEILLYVGSSSGNSHLKNWMRF